MYNIHVTVTRVLFTHYDWKVLPLNFSVVAASKNRDVHDMHNLAID